jgi:hypothetical protein
MSDDVLILSDLHGAFYTMTRLLNRAPKALKVVFAGDLIDRGPHSRKVVEFAMSHGIPTTMGNHEDLAMAFYRPSRSKCGCYYDEGVWLENGGRECLRNWPALDKRAAKSLAEYHRDKRLGGRVPDDVLDWMEGLTAYLYPSERLDENGRKLLLSHTGYGLAADLGTPDGWMTTLWARRATDNFPFATDPKTGLEIDDGLYRVYGHTTVKKVVVQERECNIDSGAAYSSRGCGTLSALLWPSKTIMTEPFDESPCEPKFTIVDGRLA